MGNSFAGYKFRQKVFGVSRNSELENVKTVEDCLEIVQMDAYDAGELAMAWLTCLEEIFVPGSKIRVSGQKGILIGFEIQESEEDDEYYGEGEYSMTVICDSGDGEF